jgi:DNA-binding NarL/FixJ family response regulator
MSRSSARCTVAIIDSKNLRRASISSFMWPWASFENLQPETFSLDQAHELLHETTNLRMLVLSIGGESIAPPQNLQRLTLLRALATNVPLTIISDREELQDIAAALIIGAKGFIHTGMDPLLAHRALSFVLNGGSYFPLSALHQFLTIRNPVVNPTDIAESRFRHDSDSEIDNSCGQLSHDVNSKPTKLTPRQRDVLDHIRLGESNKMIARCLGVTEGTVKVHIRQMMRKFHASDRTQLVLDELDVQCASGSRRGQLEHVPPQLNRGDSHETKDGRVIGTDSLLGAGRCRGLIPGTCVSE